VVVGSSQLRYPSVVVDNASAARALARGLVAVGHRRFGIAAGPSNQVTSHDRVSGFLAGLAEERVRVEMDDLVHCDFSRDGGFEAGKALARRLAHLDHVAAMSDAMAVGLIAGFREVGAAVPEDLEVSGFDHVPMLGDVMPTFSTVEVPLGQFGEAALTLIEDESTAATTVISLPSCPIVRGRRLDLVDR
jgi:LacI family transcriptional regulator